MKLNYSDSNDVFTIKNSENVTYLSFDNLEKTNIVLQGFSTRRGGVSSGEFSSMNLSFMRGDKEEYVRENFNRISKAIGSSMEKIVCSKQTHTANVKIVDKTFCGNGITKENILEDIDGLVTNDPEVCLFTSYADCVPLYFVDPVKKVIGLSHSGWRGTVARIGKETIRVMEEDMGCDIHDIICAIGPSICQSCYEVNYDVIKEFKREFNSKYWNEIFYTNQNDGYQLDLWKVNEIILRESGILEENITTTNVCTSCNWEELFSHRVSNGKRGNLGALLALKKEV